jgi:hypothetical protein
MKSNPYRTDDSLPCFSLGRGQADKLNSLYELFKVKPKKQEP